MVQTPSAPPRRRPSLVMLAPVVLALLVAGGWYLSEAWSLLDGSFRLIALVPLVVLGVLSVLAALAMVAGRRIGWILAVSLAGWSLVFLLVSWWLGSERYLLLAISAGMTFLLHSPEMRASYGAVRRPR